MHVRQAWIDATQFHELDEPGVLQEIYRRIQQSPRPVVLLDLDSTLYEVAPRTHEILKEWASSSQGRLFGSIAERLLASELSHIGYSLKDTFASLGLDLNDAVVHRAWESAKHFWAPRFFSNAYLRYDRPYEGAVPFAQELFRAGAQIIYLTGRDEPRMGEGTRARLIEDGFPFDRSNRKTELVLKADPHTDDREHKEQAGRRIREHGELIASFENEPANLIALQRIFPEAMHVFVETACSDHPAAAGQGCYRIRRFVP